MIRCLKNRPWRRIGYLALLLFGLVHSLHADLLSLPDDARLSGTVRKVHEDGAVEMESILSPDTLHLEPGVVSKIEFTDPGLPIIAPGTLIELVNGDLLPATVESLAEDQLKVISSFTGALNIPRAAVKSLKINSHQHRLIYTGPKLVSDWKISDSRTQNWQFSNRSLIANRPAITSKKFETPLNFIFKFDLKWQGVLNFKLYFADPLTANKESLDRYSLTFDSTNITIAREATVGDPTHTMLFLSRTPEQLSENAMKVEIRVDRKNSRLYLYLDGEPEGVCVDPSAAVPQGNGVRLVTEAGAGTTIEVRNIEVVELDNTALPRPENGLDLTLDSLLSCELDRWTGRLTAIRQSSEGNVYLLKSDFQPEPLEILECDLTDVFFARPESPSSPTASPPFILRLRGGGHFSVASCVLSSESITAEHPLLGSLKINRAAVSAMEHVTLETRESIQE